MEQNVDGLDRTVRLVADSILVAVGVVAVAGVFDIGRLQGRLSWPSPHSSSRPGGFSREGDDPEVPHEQYRRNQYVQSGQVNAL
jgi:hypothetical protein